MNKEVVCINGKCYEFKSSGWGSCLGCRFHNESETVHRECREILKSLGNPCDIDGRPYLCLVKYLHPEKSDLLILVKAENTIFNCYE